MSELDGMVISYAKTPGIPAIPTWRSIIMKCTYVPPESLERFAKRWRRFVVNTGMGNHVDVELDYVSYCVALDFKDREPPTEDYFLTIISSLDRYCVVSTTELKELGRVPFITEINVIDPQSAGWFVDTFNDYNNFIKRWLRHAVNVRTLAGVPNKLFKTMVGYDYGHFEENDD